MVSSDAVTAGEQRRVVVGKGIEIAVQVHHQACTAAVAVDVVEHGPTDARAEAAVLYAVEVRGL